jgi:hypothetical protein
VLVEQRLERGTRRLALVAAAAARDDLDAGVAARGGVEGLPRAPGW